MEKELETAYEEYIALLEKVLGDVAGYLYVHGMKASAEDIEAGEKCRARIKELKSPSL